MSSGLPSFCRTSLIAVALLATGALLRAADTTSSTSDEKTVPVSVGGKTIPFRVKQQNDPLKHASFPDELDPRKVFSATNDMANKTYSPDSITLKKDSDFTNRDRNTFPTKAYNDSALPDSSNSKTFATSRAFTKGTHDYNKSFPTTTDLGGNRTAVLSQNPTSNDQNRTAILGGPDKQEVLASNDMSNKQYLGPGAQKVPDGVVIKDNLVLSRMSGVPDRPLSIDEVRNLINHGTVPDTTVKPDAPSKALNDPDYQPEPLRDTPLPISRGGPKDDDESVVPEPGTMSLTPPPENSQPLPQR